MVKLYKILAVIMLTASFIFMFSVAGFGNSAEPPSILIIVPNAPNNLEIGIGANNTYSKANVIDKGNEKYYIFYSREIRVLSSYTLKIKTDESTFSIPIDGPLKAFNNIYTLDLKNKTLTSGKLLSRSILLVTLRMTLTLLIEGIIFYLMGYRHKKSWIAFIVINIITQGALNIWINGFSPVGSYLIISLIFGEMFVFIAEIFAFLLFVQEHRLLRTFLYVLIANFLSLIAGGYIISILPI